tara:strand:+ start:6804 stop:8717 length:1914 start_codon:yes stop_codon:yes gene_type:complete
MLKELIGTQSAPKVDNLLPGFEELLRNFGVSEKHPWIASLWTYQQQLLWVASMHVKEDTMRKSFMRYGFHVSLYPKNGPVRLLFGAGLRTRRLLGFLHNDQLHLIMSAKPTKGIKKQTAFVQKFILSYLAHPESTPFSMLHKVSRAFVKRPHPHADVYLQLNDTKALLQFASLKKLLKRIPLIEQLNIKINLKRGFQYQSHVTWKPAVKPLLQLLQPPKTSFSWLEDIPASLGWFSHTNLNPKALTALFAAESANTTLNLTQRLILQSTLRRFVMSSKKAGFSYKTLLPELNGQLSSGIVWDKKIESDVKHWNNGKVITKYKRGIFVRLGLKRQESTKLWMQGIQRLRGNIPTFRMTQSVEGGFPVYTLRLQKEAPIYMMFGKKNITFVFHPATKATILSVWSKKTRSLSQKMGAHPRKARGPLPHVSLISPRAIRALHDVFAPAPWKAALRPLYSRIQRISTHVMTYNNVLDERLTVTLLPPNKTAPKWAISPNNKLSSPPTYPREERWRGFLIGSLLAFPTAFPLTIEISAIMSAMTLYFERQKRSLARTQVCKLQYALKLFRLRTGRFPSQKEGLQLLLSYGIIRASLVRDPWHRHFVYIAPNKKGSEPKVFSRGPTGAKNALQTGQAITCKPE